MNRFSEVLKKLVTVFEDCQRYVHDLCGVGSHSNRKGAVTFCFNFAWVTAVNVYLRAGWTLGNVQDRYIIGGAAGDQRVGRVVCGNPTTDLRFGALPPRFQEADMRLLLSIGLTKVFPNYDAQPDTFKAVIPYLIASILFHQSWMRENLSRDHPIFSSPIFTKGIDELDGQSLSQKFDGKILGGILRCEDTGLEATGIPEHLVTQHMMVKFEENALRHMQEISEKLDSTVGVVVAEVVDGIRKNFEVEGVSSMTPSELSTLISNTQAEGQAAMQVYPYVLIFVTQLSMTHIFIHMLIEYYTTRDSGASVERWQRKCSFCRFCRPKPDWHKKCALPRCSTRLRPWNQTF